MTSIFLYFYAFVKALMHSTSFIFIICDTILYVIIDIWNLWTWHLLRFAINKVFFYRIFAKKL